MQIQYAMVIDSSKCFNCKACVTACQVENSVPSGCQRNWVRSALINGGSQLHFQPGNCMQCAVPTCVDVCPTGATYKDLDGIVKVNKSICIGCGSCIPACPYGARFLNPSTRAVDKCDYCERRLELGKQPACVVVCPTKARTFGNFDDSGSQVSALVAVNKTVRVINQETNTDPQIYYLTETAPVDWTVPASIPAPIRLFRDLGGPFIKTIVGLAGFGVLAMLGKQLLSKDADPDEDRGQEGDE